MQQWTEAIANHSSSGVHVKWAANGSDQLSIGAGPEYIICRIQHLVLGSITVSEEINRAGSGPRF